MKPIRILHVVGRMDRGGIETLIMNIYRTIDRSMVQFDFLAHYGKEADYNEEIRSLGGYIYEMPRIKSTKRTYYHKYFQYRKALNNFFSEHTEYSIIHGHMTNTAAIYMPIAKKHGVTCCIAHSHLSKSREGLTGLLTSILQINIQKHANEFFACSESAAKWLFSDKDIRSNKVVIIKNAIDSAKFKYNADKAIKVKEDLGLAESLIIGNVARFFSEKNHVFLIEIFNELISMYENSILLLIGEGVLLSSIIQEVKRQRLESKVRFLGIRDDVDDLMQAMDVFVLPSLFEGLPIVGVEAQASGLPCIMSTGVPNETDITGLVRFLPLEAGAKAWAQAILDSYKQNKRGDTQGQIIKAGYDISTTAKFLQEYYLRKATDTNLK